MNATHEATQLSLVSPGLAPTADAPTRTKGEDPQAYAPCGTCGAMVLMGMATDGALVALDTSRRSYVVELDPGTSVPRLYESRGYPQHTCLVATDAPA